MHPLAGTLRSLRICIPSCDEKNLPCMYTSDHAFYNDLMDFFDFKNFHDMIDFIDVMDVNA